MALAAHAMSEPAQAEPIDWFNAPAVVDLLVAIVAEPPVREICTQTFVLTTDRWTRYVGEQVERLRAIRHEAMCAATGVEPDAAADVDDMERWLRTDIAAASVDAVIDQALRVAGKGSVDRMVRL